MTNDELPKIKQGLAEIDDRVKRLSVGLTLVLVGVILLLVKP